MIPMECRLTWIIVDPTKDVIDPDTLLAKLALHLLQGHRPEVKMFSFG